MEMNDLTESYTNLNGFLLCFYESRKFSKSFWSTILVTLLALLNELRIKSFSSYVRQDKFNFIASLNIASSLNPTFWV